MKVISFSQQGPRALCVLSANGVIKSVTLRQPDASGGTLTYEVKHLRKFIVSFLLIVETFILLYCASNDLYSF